MARCLRPKTIPHGCPICSRRWRNDRGGPFQLLEEWKAVPQTLVEIPATKPSASTPAGMVRIPEGDSDFQISGIEVEGGNDPGVDVQYPWENEARRFHRQLVHVHAFYLTGRR